MIDYEQEADRALRAEYDERYAADTSDSPEYANSPTMIVTVRDRASESPWGSGPTNPVTRTVTISAYCPVCGERRGEPYGINSCDDGAFYWVQGWTNPCGHVDTYAAVLTEADRLTEHQP